MSVVKSGKVYGYLQIDAKNLVASLGKAVITSQVNKTWISSNGLTKDKIALWKFDDVAKVWKEVPTTWKESDAKFEYFESEVTSFSYFALGEKTAAATGDNGAAGTDTAAGGTGAGADESDGTTSGMKTWAFILLIIAAIVIIAIVVIWITTSKGKISNKKLSSKVIVKHP